MIFAFIETGEEVADEQPSVGYCRAGKPADIVRLGAVSGLAHVMAALDLDNYDEARSWLEQGRKFIRQ